MISNELLLGLGAFAFCVAFFAAVTYGVYGLGVLVSRFTDRR